MNKIQTEILIIGAGLTGATLMLALKEMGIDCLLVDANPFSDRLQADFDARSLALSPASQRILSTLACWPLLEEKSTAIHFIHVSDQQRFGATRLKGSAEEPLGYVLEMQDINHALAALLPKDQLIAPAKLRALDLPSGCATIETNDNTLEIQAKLIVAADGTNSSVRQLAGLSVDRKDYGQSAIVANILLAKPHQNRAYERFTAEGPLALLPMSAQRMALVWAMRPEHAESIMALNDDAFIQALQKAFGYRLGRFEKSGKRVVFPLQQCFMHQQIQWPVVFVGNAAHTLHPVAGQGFNLGLRDVAMLAQCIAQQGLNAAMLESYQQQRQADQKNITRLTNGLIHLFTHPNPLIKTARNIGLIAMDNLPFLRNQLTHHARGFGGIVPDLVCGFPLKPYHRSTGHEA